MQNSKRVMFFGCGTIKSFEQKWFLSLLIAKLKRHQNDHFHPSSMFFLKERKVYNKSIVDIFIILFESDHY